MELSRFPPTFYANAVLSKLEQVFHQVCADLKVAEADERFRTVVAEKLMDLAAIGITDPDELRAVTIEALRR